MTQLGNDIIDALVKAVGPVHMPDGQIHQRESDAVEGHARTRPDELEIRRRQRELEQRDMTRGGGGRR